MWGYHYIAGSTNVKVRFLARGDDGTKIKGAVAADFTCKIQLDPDDTPSELSLVNLSTVNDAHSDGGIIEVESNAGVYRLDLPDSLFATGGKNPYIRVIHADGEMDWELAVVEKSPDTLVDLAEADVRAALGLASANLDTQLTTIDGVADAIKLKTDNITAARAAKLDLIAPGDITIVAAGDGQTTRISQRAGDTWTIPLTSLGDLSSAAKLIFAIKASDADADADALLTLDLDGLQRLNGAAYGTAGHGEIDITDDAAGDITITVAAVAAELFGKRKAVWALKQVTSAGAVQTLRSGTFETTESIIDATS